MACQRTSPDTAQYNCVWNNVGRDRNGINERQGSDFGVLLCQANELGPKSRRHRGDFKQGSDMIRVLV